MTNSPHQRAQAFEQWWSSCKLAHENGPSLLIETYKEVASAAYAAALNDEAEACIEACKAVRPKQSTEASGYDDLYQAACDDCVTAIRRRKDTV